MIIGKNRSSLRKDTNAGCGVVAANKDLLACYTLEKFNQQIQPDITKPKNQIIGRTVEWEQGGEKMDFDFKFINVEMMFANAII